jgi:hypothetical protein
MRLEAFMKIALLPRRFLVGLAVAAVLLAGGVGIPYVRGLRAPPAESLLAAKTIEWVSLCAPRQRDVAKATVSGLQVSLDCCGESRGAGGDEASWSLNVNGATVIDALYLSRLAAREVAFKDRVIQVASHETDGCVRVRIANRVLDPPDDLADSQRRVLELFPWMYASLDAKDDGAKAARVKVSINGHSRYELVIGMLSGEIVDAKDVR